MTPTRKTTVLLAATALMLGYGSAMADNGQLTAAQSDAFKRFDLNRDGFIDQKESSISAALIQIFDSADSDRDGKLSLNEFSLALNKQSE